MKALTRLLVAGLLVASEVSSARARRQEESDAQGQVARRWEQRKQEALNSIDSALALDHSRNYVSTSTKQRLAEELRLEVIKCCRERNAILMTMVENRITSFTRNGC